MNVEVLFFGRLRELATRQRVVSMIGGARLSDLIDRLSEEYGDEFRREVNQLEGLRILINGNEYDLLDGMATSLKDGDVVVFLTITAGG